MNIRLFIALGIIFLISFSSQGYSQKLKKMAKLDSSLNETSGLEETGPNSLWTFNDSGGKAEIYKIDEGGKILRKIKIKNAWNRDWEDITKDTEGNFYIANTGNNFNTNTDLCIFKIPSPESVKSDEVSAKIISYSYEDQYSYPPPADSMNFDCEAIFWFRENIYLFTKHRTLPMATNLYRIPATEGNHIAKKIGTFKTGTAAETEDPISDYWITAADISPNGKKVCLISHNKLWLFYNFKGDSFFDGKIKIIDLGKSTQKEAVCFVSKKEIFISDENELLKKEGGYLYKLDL